MADFTDITDLANVLPEEVITDRGLLLLIIQLLRSMTMSNADAESSISAALTQIAGSLGDIDIQTTNTAAAVDAIQAYVVAHPDSDPELQALAATAAQVAQQSSDAATQVAAVAADAQSTFAPPAPVDTPPTDVPPVDQPPTDTPPAG